MIFTSNILSFFGCLVVLKSCDDSLDHALFLRLITMQFYLSCVPKLYLIVLLLVITHIYCLKILQLTMNNFSTIAVCLEKDDIFGNPNGSEL